MLKIIDEMKIMIEELKIMIDELKIIIDNLKIICMWFDQIIKIYIIYLIYIWDIRGSARGPFGVLQELRFETGDVSIFPTILFANNIIKLIDFFLT